MSFYEPDGDAFVATPYTRGPWDDRHQHGGPPAALLAGAMARQCGADGIVTRVTVALLRPVPIGRVRVVADAGRCGRVVGRPMAELWAEDVRVACATGVWVRARPVEVPPSPAGEPWPDPDGLEPYVFPFFPSSLGYHRAVDLRLASGAWGTTPVRFWARPIRPLVEGRPTLPIERLTILADAQSGMGPPLDLTHFTFVNPDLTVYVTREAEGDWIGFEVRSMAGPNGVGLSQSTLRDRRGEMGRSLQSLVVAQRA